MDLVAINSRHGPAICHGKHTFDPVYKYSYFDNNTEQWRWCNEDLSGMKLGEGKDG